ncbi:MAG: hypothetical protein DCF26_16865 [Burkholderiales bacterium]|nr:MAG: hypothetical protein DCF26_16865 [Burkholderiales bacterium]
MRARWRDERGAGRGAGVGRAPAAGAGRSVRSRHPPAGSGRPVARLEQRPPRSELPAARRLHLAPGGRARCRHGGGRAGRGAHPVARAGAGF